MAIEIMSLVITEEFRRVYTSQHLSFTLVRPNRSSAVVYKEKLNYREGHPVYTFITNRPFHTNDFEKCIIGMP